MLAGAGRGAALVASGFALGVWVWHAGDAYESLTGARSRPALKPTALRTALVPPMMATLPSTATTPASLTPIPRQEAPRASLNFLSDAAEKAMKSVVNLRIEEDHPGFFSDTVVRVFWHLFFFFKKKTRSQGVSLGSGVIIGSEGTIVTNAHVVMGTGAASRMTVTLHDGRTFGGVLYSVDPLTDLAVVKVTNATEMLPAATMCGADESLRPGDWVVAVGSPMGYRNTVTAGVVSAVGRRSVEVGQRVNNRLQYIQTDLAINSGNSGGPLVNVDGHVIGINTVRTSGEGISFAIRLDGAALDLVRQLAEEGRVERPWVGMRMIGLSRDTLAAIDPTALPPAVREGLLVTDIFPRSPAARAGLLRGDVIVEVDGRPVRSTGDLSDAVAAAVGRPLTLLVQRPVRGVFHPRSRPPACEARILTLTPEQLTGDANADEAAYIYSEPDERFQ